MPDTLSGTPRQPGSAGVLFLSMEAQGPFMWPLCQGAGVGLQKSLLLSCWLKQPQTSPHLEGEEMDLRLEQCDILGGHF